jgi:sugar phosphate isomerase/epimerase
MAPRITFGVNLNFAKYVYGRKRAIEVARRQLGIRHVEMVADNDFGPALHLRSPEAFRSYHYAIADHARSQGIVIPSLFTVYRDTGAIAHSVPEIRDSAYHVGLSLLEQGACYGCRAVGLSLFTMNREEAEDPERYQALYFFSLDVWKQWMTAARQLGVEVLLIEMAAAYREGCSTIDETRSTLEILDSHHRKNPDTTVPVGLCYDTGHGISRAEDRNEANRDFRAWFAAFPDRIHEIHLKNTDPDFLETWHFRREQGIIDPQEVLRHARDTLRVEDLLVYLEMPGKRGRELGEKRAIAEHVESIRIVQEALAVSGYRQSEDTHVWVLDA